VAAFSPAHRKLDLEAEVANRQSVEWAQANTWDAVCLEQHEDAGSTWRDDVGQLRRVNQAAPIILLACPGSEQLAVEATEVRPKRLRLTWAPSFFPRVFGVF